MKFYKQQRKRFSNQIKQYEDGQRLLEEENIKIIEDQRERERLMDSQKAKYSDGFSYKDTQEKTFHNRYIQQKYKNADTSFPERSTYTINIKNISSNNGYIDNYRFKEVNNKSICPGCGKLILSQVSGSYVNLCSGCGKIKQA